MGEEVAAVVVREYDPNRDRARVEDVERRCEVGPSGKLSILTDLLGDPICRVRHSPAFLMLVWSFFFSSFRVRRFSVSVTSSALGEKFRCSETGPFCFLLGYCIRWQRLTAAMGRTGRSWGLFGAVSRLSPVERS